MIGNSQYSLCLAVGKLPRDPRKKTKKKTERSIYYAKPCITVEMLRHNLSAFNSAFVVDSEYQFVKELVQGATGSVIAAKHRRSGDCCAIKKVANMGATVADGN